MNPQLRIPNVGDRERIRDGILTSLHLSLAPSGSEYIESTVSYLCDDVEYTTEMIVQNLVDATVIDNSYLLVYSIVVPWYSKNRTVLCEDMVLRIGKGSKFSRVIATLDHLADKHDCCAIVTGGALARSSKAIERLYRQGGYVLETDAPQFIKRRR